MRILLSILFCVFIANAIAPNGAAVTQSVTINSAYVSETSSHFLLQFKVPRTGLIAANCDSAKHVAMTGINDTIRVPRWVVFTTDTLFIYADVAVNTGLNTQYNMHFGKALNEVNASSTFTNCGIAAYWGLNEPSGSTSIDYAASSTLSLTGASFASGFYRNCIYKSNTSSYAYFSGKPLSLATKIVFESFVYLNDISATQILCNNQEDGGTIRFQVYISSSNIYVNTGASLASIIIGTPFTSGTWHHIVVVYDGAAATLGNRIKIYLDGVYYSNISGAALAQIPEITSGGVFNIGGRIGSTSAIVGYIDESLLSVGSTISGGYVSTRYNMLFNPSAFSTLGTVEAIPITTSGSRRSGYKSAFKSGFKNAWK